MAGPLKEVRPIRIRRVGRIFLCPLPDPSMPGCPTRHAELPDSPNRVAQLENMDSGRHFITLLPESNRKNAYLCGLKKDSPPD